MWEAAYARGVYQSFTIEAPLWLAKGSNLPGKFFPFERFGLPFFQPIG